MAEITEEPIEEQPKIKMSDFELGTYGEMYNLGAMVPMVVPPRRAEDGTPLDGEGEDGHNYNVPLSDLDGRIRMYADAAIENSFNDIVAGAATAAEAQITNEVIRLVHVSMDEYIPGIEATVMAQFPTKVSELENDAGYAVAAAVDSALGHKQDIIPDLAEIKSGAEAGATAVQPRDLATVATSGSYNDLANKPTIPAAQVNSDWNASGGVAEILHKPQLAAVATTGDYGDLSNRPSIPEPQVNSDWNADSGVAEIRNKPKLAPVATSGNYSDLAGKPSIPAKTSDLSNDSGFITAADVLVKGVTVNGSSAVNAQGIAEITVPTVTSALQNDSGFVETQSSPSANQVLTFSGSAVVWADPQGGGGGSELPPYTASDAGKVLAVDGTGTGLVWMDISTEATIDIGDYLSVMTGEGGEPSTDVSTAYRRVFDALCDSKKVLIKGTMYGGEVMLKGYLDDFSIGGNYTLADLWEMYQGYGFTKDDLYAEMMGAYESDPEMLTFAAYLINVGYGIEVKIEITPDGHYVSPRCIVRVSDDTGRICLEMATGGPTTFALAPSLNAMQGLEWDESSQAFVTNDAHINSLMAYVMAHGRFFEFGTRQWTWYGGFVKVGTMPDPEHPEAIWATAEYILKDCPVDIVLTADNETLTMAYEGVAYENDDPYHRVTNYRSHVGNPVNLRYSSTWHFDASFHGFAFDSESVTVLS